MAGTKLIKEYLLKQNNQTKQKHTHTKKTLQGIHIPNSKQISRTYSYKFKVQMNLTAFQSYKSLEEGKLRTVHFFL